MFEAVFEGDIMFFAIQKAGRHWYLEAGIFGWNAGSVNIVTQICTMELKKFLTICQRVKEYRL
ncbi:hypothetical protein [Gluconobacter sp. Dm-44]|uniref:hypothetical protein n=2 Tax=Acetobacteraceae TaxID=433 RepID=UPI002010E9EC|nr:hypothetical protein [Gluconobacter sp. Dm-44]